MSYTEQNPPAVQNPYDYTNPDIRQVAALIAQGGGIAAQGIINIVQQNFPAGPGPTFGVVLNTNESIPTGCKIVLSLENYTILTTDSYTIQLQNFFGPGQPLVIQEGLISDILRVPNAPSSNRYTTDFFGIPPGADITVTLTIGNPFNGGSAAAILTPLTGISAGDSTNLQLQRISRSLYNVPSAENAADILKNIETICNNSNGKLTAINNNLIFDQNTQVEIRTASNPANLVTNVNAFLSSLSPVNRVLNCSYAIDPAGGANSHQCLITYK